MVGHPQGVEGDGMRERILHKVLALFFIFLFPVLITMCGGNGSDNSSTHSISGRITTSNGAGLSGVTVILDGVYAGCSGTRSATTDANGYYSFTTDSLYSGSGTLTPLLHGYAFSPASRPISAVGNSDFRGQDFMAMPLHSIYGTVTMRRAGLAGIAITLSGAPSIYTVVTNNSGGYSFGDLASGTYTVTPSSAAGYVFTPENRTITLDTNSDSTGQDFTAACASGYVVSGNIALAGGSGLPGVTVLISNTAQNTDQYVTSDVNGFYLSSCVQNGPYTITPFYNAGYVISPVKQVVTVSGADITGQDFTISPTYSVSGTVMAPDGTPLSGSIITLSNMSSSMTVTTDVQGRYTFPGILNGTYTLVPSTVCPTYIFTPAVRTITVSNADIVGQDFASVYSSAVTYSVSGRITATDGSGIEGVIVNLVSAATSSLTTDANGFYDFIGLRNGLYTIRPSGGNYAYLPEQKSVSICNSDVPAQDFAAIKTWVKRYSGTIASIQQTSDGRYIAIGSISIIGAGGSAFTNVWVVRLDSNGEILWQKTYGGPVFDYGKSISPTPDGGYIAAGETDSFGAGSRDIWVLKLDAMGNILWQQTYGGNDYDWLGSIQTTVDGGYVVAGGTYSFGAGNADPWVLKLDAKGAVEWQRYYSSIYYGEASAVRQTSDGGYVIAGGTYSFGAGSEDGWILKLDANGNVLWQNTYGGTTTDFLTSIQLTSDGGYIAAGYTYSFGAGYGDIWVLKFNADGSVLWQKAYGGTGGTGNDTANAVRQTADGGYVVAGNYLIKLDANGSVLWKSGFSGTVMTSLQQTADGAYIASGGNSLLKLDALGGLDWCNMNWGSPTLTTKSTNVIPAISTAATYTSTVTVTTTAITPMDIATSVTQVCPAL